MSPEQARGGTKDVTTSADVYGLGAVLYETLAGSPPFAGGTSMETVRQVLEQEPRRPSILNPAIDRDLETICLKCLEKDPTHRYDSAAALVEDLDRWLEHKPILARRANAFERVLKWSRRQPVLAGATVLLLFVMLAGLTGVLWQWREAVIARRAETSARQRAVRAEADALARLHEAKLNYARAQRLSGRPGQRFASLTELADAASGGNHLELRNEAIACLVLPDLRPFKTIAKKARSDSLTLDPNLRQYLTNDPSGNVVIRDVESDSVQHVIPQQGARITTAIMSPDASLVATSDRAGHAYLWSLPVKAPRPLEFPSEASLFTFTPDSRTLVVRHADDSLHFLNITSGLDERAFPALGCPWVQFNSVGDKFLTQNENEIVIRRSLDGKHLRTLRAPEGAIKGLSYPLWHPDGRRIACVCHKNIGLWDSESGRELGRFVGHETTVVGLAFVRMGEYLASAAWDGSTRIWHVETQAEVLTMPDSGNALSISADDRRLSYETWDHRQTKIYELADLTPATRFTLPPPAHPVHFLGHSMFTPDGKLMIATDEEGIFVFDVSSPSPVAVVPVLGTHSSCFSPDGTLLYTGDTKGVQCWPLRRSRNDSELQIGPPSLIERTRGLSIARVDLSADGKWLTARGKNVVLTLQTDPPSPVVRFDTTRVGALPQLSPSGRYVAIIDPARTKVEIRNGQSGGLITNLPSLRISNVAFSPDGRWLACAEGTAMTVWKTADWTLSRRFPYERDEERQPLAFSPDGQILAVFGSSRDIRLLKFETGEELARLPARLVRSFLCFSPTGDRLAATYELGDVQVWDLRRLRAQLAALKLDWDMPPYPPPRPSLSHWSLHVVVHAKASAAGVAGNAD